MRNKKMLLTVILIAIVLLLAGGCGKQAEPASTEPAGAVPGVQEGISGSKAAQSDTPEEAPASTATSNPTSEPAAASAQEPAASAEERTASAQEPAASAQEPAASAEEPTASAQEPTVSAQEPAAPAQEPAAAFTPDIQNTEAASSAQNTGSVQNMDGGGNPGDNFEVAFTYNCFRCGTKITMHSNDEISAHLAMHEEQDAAEQAAAGSAAAGTGDTVEDVPPLAEPEKKVWWHCNCGFRTDSYDALMDHMREVLLLDDGVMHNYGSYEE